MPEISIKAETLFHIGSFPIKNSMVLSAFVFLFFLYLSITYYRESKKEVKSGVFYILNLVLRTLYDMFASIVHDKVNVFFPLLSAFFLWILIQNWTGLLPGVGSITLAVREPVVHEISVSEKTEHKVPSKVNSHEVKELEKETTELKHIPLLRGNNADLNATLALAIISMTMVQVYGIKYLGLAAYLHKFINLSDPINFFLGILDIMSEFSKVLSFAFRLFGNIFAGEVLMTIVAFLVPVLASFPFLILEIFVGFVQALVFSMLTSVFFSMSVSHH